MRTLPDYFYLLYYSKLLTIVNIIIYDLFIFFIVILFYTYFHCIVEGANSHTFHYDYTLHDYM